MQSIEISGVRNDSINMRTFLSSIDSFLAENKKTSVILTGAHGIVFMQTDEKLKEINNSADIVTPDGMSVVFCHWMLGRFHVRKVYAPTIMINLFSNKYAKRKHYFIGGKDQETLDNLLEVARDKFGVKNVRGFCPPFRPLNEEEEAFLAKDTASFDPDFVWIGLGCPKQEKFIDSYKERIGGRIFIGVGAGFDFISGKKPLASTLVQNSGFEWLYRLVTDFKYLWPRYRSVVPKMLKIMLLFRFRRIRS